MAVKKRSARTVGGYELARVGKSQVQIATEVGVSKVTVHQWFSGEKKPGPSMREKLRALYGIAPKRFDERFAPTQSKRVAPPIESNDDDDDGVAEIGGAFAMARSLQRQAQAQLDELELAGDSWTPAEKAQVMQRLASTVNVLAKITGQYELGRRMLSLPIWKQLEREMFDVLKAYPEASAAVAERLERFERSWMGKSE